MAYNYANPFQAQAPSRSTFGAASGSSGYQVLFGGLPLDVTEKDIRVSGRAASASTPG
jgi:hypothetical protein